MAFFILKRNVDIYKVKDKATDQVSIIKLLNRNKLRDIHKFNKKVTRLEREYFLLQKAENIPSISKAYAFEKDNFGNVFIVLEFINGKSLSRFLNDIETFDEPDYLEVMKNLLEGFSSLHRQNLIHGDIHPSNVLVDQDKSVRIIDLGFSRNAHTEKNEVLKFGGVNFYMPPERINITTVKKYTKEPDLYSDVYQIGVLLYQILYNTVPFNGFIWEDLARNIKEAEINYPEVTFCNISVHPGILQIIKKCLEKNPLERYSDATNILQECNNACHNKKALL